MAAQAHRKNSDGTWDSICLSCFRTIARAEVEAKLRQQEREHDCVPLQFSHQAVSQHATNETNVLPFEEGR